MQEKIPKFSKEALAKFDRVLKEVGPNLYGQEDFLPREDCPDEETLAGYVDGTLSPTERKDVEKHFASCPRCLANSFRVWQSLEQAKSPARVKSPEALTKTVKQRIKKGKEGPEAKPGVSLIARAEKYLNEGMDFFRRAEYESALQCVMRALQIKPQWGRALDLKANCEKKILKQKEKIANEDYI